MSNISAIMDVFNMENVSAETRARLIIKLGRAINDEMAMNLTEELVYELVSLIDPTNEILENEHYKMFATTNQSNKDKSL